MKFQQRFPHGLRDEPAHFGFAMKARQPVRIAGQRSGQYFDRDRSFQIAVGGAKHFTHTPSAERRGDLVGPDSGAGSEGQLAGL